MNQTGILLVFLPAILLGIRAVFRLKLMLPRTAAWLAWGAAVMSVAGVAITLGGVRGAFSQSRLAWLGASTSESTLSIGGSRDDSDCGWPVTDGPPRLEFHAPAGTNKAVVTISGGYGFVEMADGQVLNGTRISLSEDVPAGPVTLRADPAQWKSRASLRVTTASGTKGEVRAPSWVPWLAWWPGNASRVSVLHGGDIIARLRQTGRTITEQELPALETWAETLRLRYDRDGVHMLTSAASPVRHEITLPAEMVVRWSDRRILRFTVARAQKDSGIAVWFHRAWRHTCGLPPTEPGSKESAITFAASGLPEKNTFLLPLGGRQAEVRHEVRLITEDDGTRLANPDILDPVRMHPPDSINGQWKEAKLDGKHLLRVPGAPDARGHPAMWFSVGLVRDLPDPGRWEVKALLVLPLLMLAWGLALLSRVSSRKGAGAAVALLTAALWAFLCFRVLLAVRGTLSPEHLDGHAVNTVVQSLCAMVVCPGLLLLAAAGWTDSGASAGDRSTARTSRHIYGLCLAGVAALQYWLASRLWPETPSAGKIAAAAAIAAFTLAVTCRMMPRFMNGVWEFLKKPVSFTDWLKILAGALMVLVVPPLFVRLFPSELQDLLGEAILPLLCIWLPAAGWLAWQAAGNERRQRPARSRSLLLLGVTAFLLAWLPAVVSAVGTGDAGGALPALFPVGGVCILLLLARRRGGGLALVGAFAVLVGMGLLNWQRLGEARIRIDAWNLDVDGMEREFIFGDVLPTDSPVMHQSRKVGNVVQHLWENGAMVHHAGISGKGYSMAPVRASRIPQEVLQYDSVFSFFVIGDWGLYGGILLMLAGSAPLLIVLGSARARMDAGHGLAAVIMFTFMMETFMHSLMNVNAIPFTGRNLPLLAASSLSDICRWAILFGLAGAALFWRHSNSLLCRPCAAASLLTEGRLERRDEPDGEADDARGAWAAAFVILVLLPVLICVGTVRSAARHIIADVKGWGKPFEWSNTRRTIESFAREATIERDKSAPDRILMRPSGNIDDHGSRLLLHEMRRFNELPESEKYLDRGLTARIQKLNLSSSLQEYDHLMAGVRREDETRTRERRPTAFILARREKDMDEDEDGEPDPPGSQQAKPPGWDRLLDKLEIQANPAFLSRFQFQMEKPTEFPCLIWRAGGSGTGTQPQEKVLASWGWVMGNFKMVHDPDPAIPWTGQLSEILVTQCANTRSVLHNRGKLELTLSEKLHRAAQNFMTEKGRGLHRQLLPLAGNRPVDHLPPRVGLAVIRVPDGETLALGGWPRMHSGPTWLETRDGERVPPAGWVMTDAPEPVAQRYGGDRNFDLHVMGSTTKPLWARVAARLHPEIPGEMKVNGQGSVERSLFGITIPGRKGWKGSSKQGLGFDDYLSFSDNAYHARIGFLTLADRDGNGRTAVVQGAVSTAGDVLMNGAPWRRYPAFMPDIGFSHLHPGSLRDLEQTPMALAWRDLHGVRVMADQKGQPQDMLRPQRLSFWTGRLIDDIAPLPQDAPVRKAELIDPPDSSGGKTADGGTESISAGGSFEAPEGLAFLAPNAPNFELNLVDRPRIFISMLFGGASNRWSNVDFAGAFASAVSGEAVVPHILRLDLEDDASLRARRKAPGEARILSKGLNGTVTKKGGTVFNKLNTSARNSAGRRLLDLCAKWGVEPYAKTGTLAEEGAGGRQMSRLVLVLLKKDTTDGLCFSLFAERAEASGYGTATLWLAEFVLENEEEIGRLLEKPH